MRKILRKKISGQKILKTVEKNFMKILVHRKNLGFFVRMMTRAAAASASAKDHNGDPAAPNPNPNLNEKGGKSTASGGNDVDKSDSSNERKTSAKNADKAKDGNENDPQLEDEDESDPQLEEEERLSDPTKQSTGGKTDDDGQNKQDENAGRLDDDSDDLEEVAKLLGGIGREDPNSDKGNVNPPEEVKDKISKNEMLANFMEKMKEQYIGTVEEENFNEENSNIVNCMKTKLSRVHKECFDRMMEYLEKVKNGPEEEINFSMEGHGK